MNSWEKGTPLDKLVHKEEHGEKDLSFEQKAEQYLGRAEIIVAAEQLTTLVRGFITGCGGVGKVGSEACSRFVKDHPKVVRTVMGDIPEEERPAAVYALALTISRNTE